MSNNPYSAPVSPTSKSGSPNPSIDSSVKQIPIVGILMIAAGVIELLAGIALASFSFFVPQLIANQNNPAFNQMDPQQLATLMTWVYIGMGLPAALAGLLRLVAGIQILRFKSWLFGVIANFMGLLALSSCYCTPISLGVSIYALIILFQSPVKLEFARRAVV